MECFRYRRIRGAGAPSNSNIFPFYNVLIISVAKFEAISKSDFYIFPLSFDLSAYKLLLQDMKFWTSIFNSVIVTVVGVLFSMTISVAELTHYPSGVCPAET